MSQNNKYYVGQCKCNGKPKLFEELKKMNLIYRGNYTFHVTK